jgi:hypothetical protein
MDGKPLLNRSTTQIVPLFPLPNVVLFPGTAMPLHIFEPRYRQMVEDLLDRAGRLVIGTVLPEYVDQLPGAPPVHPVAGLGEIVRHDKLPDGRYNILVYGLCRVHLQQAESDRLYRQVGTHPIEEVPLSDDQEAELRPELAAAVRERVRMKIQLPENISPVQLTDLLLLTLRLPEPLMLDLFSRPQVVERAQGALEQHATRPIQSPEIMMDAFQHFDFTSRSSKDEDADESESDEHEPS